MSVEDKYLIERIKKDKNREKINNEIYDLFDSINNKLNEFGKKYTDKKKKINSIKKIIDKAYIEFDDIA